MKTALYFIICLLICFVSSEAVGQQKKKKFKGNKGTSKREMRKRQEEANKRNPNTNAFNPVQSMGARQNDARDDLLWHSESANTVYDKAGNISLTSPSRYGLKPGLELSSVLPLNYWVPNLFIKKRWLNTKWYISTRHGLYSGTPGFNWAQKNGYKTIADTSWAVPFLLTARNEIMLSRLISKNNTCSRAQPYVIITLGLGADYGVAFDDNDLEEIDEHFLANRSAPLTGNGLLTYAKLRADWQINGYLVLGGAFRYYYGDFTGQHAFEQQTDLQTFILPAFSVSIGYNLSYANYNLSKRMAIIPSFDLTWHFGRRQGREKGLFKSKMF
ncbi:MAG: hypothetical protein JEZ14_04010 [Marinilabiliaceae bacterium]|nr:hypothetical protein [Marinilabiliaceae bacterium]